MRRLYLVCFVVVVGTSLWIGLSWINFIKTPLVAKGQPAVNFILPPKTSAKHLAYQLQELHLLTKPKFFIILSRLKGASSALKAGEYQVDPGITPEMLLKKMVNGEVINHQFKIIEGWTFQQIKSELVKNTYIIHTINGLTDDEIMQHICHEGEMPEGRFAPDTYLFSGVVKDSDLLNSAYQLMQKRIYVAWNGRPANVLYHCPYEALIVASIIEKETATESEKPIIAGVILQRLAKNMLLQVDPTVIYGLGTAYKGKFTTGAIAIDTRYNTYHRKGLPPSPISMPSATSIYAALHPIMGNMLYYVAKGDGTHVFSATLKEQNAAIKKIFKKQLKIR